MKKVFHLTGAEMGGAERQLLSLLKVHERRNNPEFEHSVIVVRPGPLVDAFAEVVPTAVLNKTAKVDLAFLRQVRAILREERPEVFHAWAPTPNLWGPLVAATLPKGHRPLSIVAEVGLDEWKGGLLRALDKLSYREADAIVGCAVAVTDNAVRRGADPLKTDTVYLGVDVPPQPERNPVADRVHMLARVDWRKGHQNLLDAWPQVIERVPSARLVMAGPAKAAEEIELQRALRERIAAEPVLAASVELRDFAQPEQFLAEAELLVVPSLSEGLPNVILEAFAHRVPVVASDVGGISELVHGTQGGWCVQPGNPSVLAQTLVEALTSKGESQRRADHGREFVEKLTLERSLERWEDLYRRLLRQGGAT